MRLYRIMVWGDDGWELGYRVRPGRGGADRKRGRDRVPLIYHTEMAVKMAAHAIREKGEHGKIRVEVSEPKWDLFEEGDE